uniref:Uncharacterized protein n=1 Tax=Arundo donax TaxID=35708 RepID=A0A0A9AED6_ARUDO
MAPKFSVVKHIYYSEKVIVEFLVLKID